MESSTAKPSYRIEAVTIHNGQQVQQFSLPANSETEKRLLSTCLLQTHKACNEFFTARCKEEGVEKENAVARTEQQGKKGGAKTEDEETQDLFNEAAVEQA